MQWDASCDPRPAFDMELWTYCMSCRWTSSSQRTSFQLLFLALRTISHGDTIPTRLVECHNVDALTIVPLDGGCSIAVADGEVHGDDCWTRSARDSAWILAGQHAGILEPLSLLPLMHRGSLLARTLAACVSPPFSWLAQESSLFDPSTAIPFRYLIFACDNDTRPLSCRSLPLPPLQELQCESQNRTCC